MTLPDPGTDPVPDEPYRYPLLARWFGVDVHARQIADAISNGPDVETLEEVLVSLRATGEKLDSILPVVQKGTHPNVH